MATSPERLQELREIIAKQTGGSSSDPFKKSKGLPSIADTLSQLKEGKSPKDDIRATFSQDVFSKTPEELKTQRQEVGQDIKQAGAEIKESIQSGQERVAENTEEFNTGEISKGSRIFQNLGAGAKGASNFIGSVIKGGAKILAGSDEQETNVKEDLATAVTKIGEFNMPVVDQEGGGLTNIPLKDAVSNTGQALLDGIDYDNLSTEKQENLIAIGEVVEILSEFIGAGSTKKALRAGSEVVEQGITRGQDLAEQLITIGGKKGEDVAKAVGSKASDVAGAIASPFKVIGDVAGDIAGEFSPSSFGGHSFTKAFKLAPSDITNLQAMTGGQDVARWANANNLIKDTGAETMESITKFKQNNYDAVRDAVLLVDDKLSFKDIPEAANIADSLIDDISGMKSSRFQQLDNQLKDAVSRLNKGEGTLSDVQMIKSSFDDLTSIYKRGGDVKQGLKFQDLAESASSMRRYIEDRVAEQFPDIDIRQLNNNVRISKTLVDDIVKRSGKIDTQAVTSLGDYFIFGLGQQAVPGLGVATVGLKKIAESTPVRMRLARYLAGKGDITPTDIEGIQKIIREELEASIGLNTN